MPGRRTLSLKREVLQEITADELAGVGGGTRTDPTGMSCLDYISCWAWRCIASRVICPE